MMNNFYVGWEERLYASLEDYLRSVNAWNEQAYDFFKVNSNEFQQFFQAVVGEACPTEYATEEVNILWAKYIVPKFRDYGIACLRNESELKEKGRKFFNRFMFVLNETLPKYKTILVNFKAEESNLMDALENRTSISGYTNGTTNSTISSTDTNKGTVGIVGTGNKTDSFNDTPQVLGAVEDRYTTNINKSNSETNNTTTNNLTNTSNGTNNTEANTNINQDTVITADNATKIARLNEIHEGWVNIYKEWREEFSPLFMVI